MYFESMDSLERTVEQTSDQELQRLVAQAKKVFDLSDITSKAHYTFVKGEGTIPSNPGLADLVPLHMMQYSLVSQDQPIGALGMTAMPPNGSLPMVYSLCNRDTDKQGQFAYTNWAVTADTPQSYNWTTNQYDLIMMEVFVMLDGKIGPLAWAIPNQAEYNTYLGLNPRTQNFTETRARDREWEAGPDNSYVHTLVDNYGTTEDGVIYTFAVNDRMYPVPDAPHVFSEYSMLFLLDSFSLSHWQTQLDEYKAANPETDVIIIGVEHGTLHASTTGHTPLTGECPPGWGFKVPHCFHKVHHLPEHVREAWADTSAQPLNTFIKSSGNFIRRSALNNKMHVLWIRPVSFVQGEVNDALYLLAAFSVGVLLFDTVISVCEIMFVAIPLKMISRAVLLVAKLQGEEAREVAKGTSGLVKEIAHIKEATLVLADNVELYKSFLPMNVKDAVADSSKASEEEAVSELSRSQSSLSMSGSNRSRTVGSAQNVAMGVAEALNMKVKSSKVSLLLTNAVGLLDAGESVEDAHTKYVDSVLTVASMSKGVPEMFNGDRFVVVYNGTRTCSNHAVSSVRGGLALQNETVCTTACAVGTGKMQHGYLGTQSMRCYGVLSRRASFCYGLLQVCTDHKAGVLMDALCANNQTGHIRTAAFAFFSHHKEEQVVYKAICVLEAKNEEWMYQLESMETVQDHLLVAYKAANSGDWDAARSSLGQCKHDYPLLEQVKRAVGMTPKVVPFSFKFC